MKLHARFTTRRIMTGALALVSTMALAVAGLVLAPTAANAAEATLTNIRTVVTDRNGNPISQIHVHDGFVVTMTFDLQDDVVAGDTFRVDFPAVVEGFGLTFPLLAPDGAVVANCVQSAASAQCELTDFVTGRDGFRDFTMTLHFAARAVTDAVSFAVGGAGVPITLPGNGGVIVRPSIPLPTTSTKGGWIDSVDAGRYNWSLLLVLAEGTERVRFTDTPGEGQTFLWTTLAHSFLAEEWTGALNTSGTPFTVPDPTLNADGSFTYDFAVPAGADVIRLEYLTQLPAGIHYGDAVTNVVEGDFVLEARRVYDIQVGGTGNGNLIPDLVIEKAVTGLLAPTDGREYVFEIACTSAAGAPLAGSPWTRSAVAGGIATVVDIPVGSRCAVTEAQASTAGTTDVQYSLGSSFTIPASGEYPVRQVVTNVYPDPVPAISIVKADADGNDADTVDAAVDLTATGGAADLVFTITNEGEEALRDIAVSDSVVGGGTVADLVCTFPDASTGVTWAGPLAVDATFTCTARLTGVTAGQAHVDTGRVTGTGVLTGDGVESENAYHALVQPPQPQAPVDPEDPEIPDALPLTSDTPAGLAVTGANAPLGALWLGFLALLGGAALLIVRRRESAAVSGRGDE